jgi:hypothetical protein
MNAKENTSKSELRFLGSEYEDGSLWDTDRCSLVVVDQSFINAFRPDDGSSNHIRNVCLLLRDYTAQPKDSRLHMWQLIILAFYNDLRRQQWIN